MQSFRFSRQVYIVLLGRFVSDLGRGFTMPFSAIYFREEVGLSATVIGAGRLSFAATGFVAVFWGGYLADRFGRRRSLLLSLLASAFLYPLFPLVGDSWSYLTLSVLSGAFLSLYWPVCAAMLTDLTPPAARGRVYSLLRIAINAGIGLGVVLAGFTVEALQGVLEKPQRAYHALFYIDGLTYLLFSAVIFFFVVETLPPEAAGRYEGFRKGWSQSFRDVVLVRLTILNVLFTLCYSLFDPAFPLFFREEAGLDHRGVSLVMVVNTVMCVFLQVPLWSLVERWTRTRILMVSALFFIAGLLSFDLVAALPGAGFAVAASAMAVFTIGELLHGPASTALFGNLAPDHLRGTYMSAQSLSWATGMGIGPVAAGAFFDAGHPFLLWPVYALLPATAIVALVCLRRTLPGAVDLPEDARRDVAAPRGASRDADDKAPGIS